MVPASTTPASAACGDGRHAVHATARVVFNRRIADHVHRVRIEAPHIAATAVPGQFAMLRLPDRNDPLLARAFAVYDTFAGEADELPLGPPKARRFVDFVSLVHGKFTTALAAVAAGADLTVWGPLGNGFGMIPAVEHLLLVAGGIGQTALLALGRQRLGRAAYGPGAVVPAADRVTLCWGARHAGLFGGVEDFRAAGIDVHLATLDGSAGHRGTVVDLLDDLAARGTIGGAAATHVACCGPDPMMAAVARWTSGRQMPCHVSLEAPMACGIGICFTCVARVRLAAAGTAWDYRRTCVEGPVFDAAMIAWDA